MSAGNLCPLNTGFNTTNFHPCPGTSHRPVCSSLQAACSSYHIPGALNSTINNRMIRWIVLNTTNPKNLNP